ELKSRNVGRARIAFVLGSGLGAFADRIQNPQVIPYAEIASMPQSSVPGHAGELVVGEIGGVAVVVQKGRVHLYEGHDPQQVTRCVRAFGELGIQDLLLTNAAGGIEADWNVPALMRITDHINLQGVAPLRSAEAGIGNIYDADLGEAIRLAGEECDVEVHEGIYAAVNGPSYETPAEIRMLRWAGASAVGMSTVQEAMVAKAQGMRVAAISAITNPAAGISKTPLNHEEVVEAGKLVSDRFCRLLEAFVPRA
ncbi:MAG: purine-nucleoside phosphorylase, partial [Planctomycetota bacterium]